MTPATSTTACPGFRALDRRRLLSVGGAALLGLSLPDLLRAEGRSRGKARAKAVIFLHQYGGPGHHASFLGKAHDPLFVGQDPNAADFRLPELSLPAHLTPGRLENRREVLKLIDRQSELLEFSAKARGIEEAYGKALGMLTAPGV